jgi:hypothetical protein
LIGTSVPSRNTSSSEDISKGVRKETKDNVGFETEHQGRSGSNFSQHAASSHAELPEKLEGMC